MKITMAHGSGGESTSQLIRDVFAKHFHNEILDKFLHNQIPIIQKFKNLFTKKEEE